MSLNIRYSTNNFWCQIFRKYTVIHVVIMMIKLLGFSFGGILAQLCASHLWTLGQDICPELLERNLLCITFGQPLILLPEMERAADRIAEHRFHAIFAADDIVPRMMRYLDTSYSTCVAQMDMPERFLLHHSSNKVCF